MKWDTLNYLKNLSKLTIENEEMFTEKLNSVINYIQHIGDVSIEKQAVSSSPAHVLSPLDTQTPAGEKHLLDNVEHEKINNSIAITARLK